MGFETDLKRVQEITALLNDPKTTLEESLKLYDEGISLSKKLEKQLSEAKRKVEMVNGNAAEGMDIVSLEEKH